MKYKKILYFAKGDRIKAASSRQRVWTPAEHLKKKYGYDYEVLFDIKKNNRILETIRVLLFSDYDIIVVQKVFIPTIVVFFIILSKYIRGKKLVFDLDDAEWIHSKLKSNMLVKTSDKIFCGSGAILKWASSHNNNSIAMPTVFDEERHIPHRITHTQSAVMTIGWVGAGGAHFKDGVFHVIKPALEELSKKIKFRFAIMSTMGNKKLEDYIQSDKYETIFLDCDDPDEIPKIMKDYNFSIGLMPLIEDAFSVAKCSGKAIEYMASGIPPVVSPIGENKVVIENGKSGLWARNKEEWIESMYKLLSDLEYRKQISRGAIEQMKGKYSINSLLPKMHNEFQTL